jgi:phage-related protein
MKKFDILLLEEAREFLLSLDEKTKEKILFNFRKAEYINDPKLFKKLTDDIWELRTEYNSIQYRFLAFWDKRTTSTIVVSSHGFIKKVDKVPKKEIDKAEAIRKIYFNL